MWMRRPISATSSPRRCRPFRAWPTRAPSLPSRPSGRRSSPRGRRHNFLGCAILKRELMLAPDYEKAGSRDDYRAEHDHEGRFFAEHRVAENKRPDHRRIVEWRYHRSRRVAITLGEKNVTHAAEKTNGAEHGELSPGRCDPPKRQRDQAGQSAD